MKLLIMGAGGMAGHMLVNYFLQQGKHQIFYTTRDPRNTGGYVLDAADFCAAEKIVDTVKPDVIINAIGVLNHFAEQDQINAYIINGILPHRLYLIAERIGARLIHISTDCVFEGTRGGYHEGDKPDGTSVYALTKALGEVRAQGHLTIRTSIIGPEIRMQGIGLMHWFMRQHGIVKGYRNVLWNGVTTLELAKVIDAVISSPISGLVHLAHQQPISKYDLLLLFQEIWNQRYVTVVPSDMPILNRTLVSTRSDWCHDVPHYRDMLKEMEQWMRENSSASESS
ncbi:SDR family oxidoreductase [Paenibacillus sp. KQZ6P-2]|uniref:dTDP-4-dehydrorhamnose reductase n=1 Tax=Paenibacillus mangrovi TaxID=2931978 RepID=A0A9X2B4F0_9BACL|nr:SDR family oxidoreductase [Paenibacillus mangrovi]MCJ8013890.1 SDR family oxidoreductase [Paenibacillus mangrovi]